MTEIKPFDPGFSIPPINATPIPPSWGAIPDILKALWNGPPILNDPSKVTANNTTTSSGGSNGTNIPTVSVSQSCPGEYETVIPTVFGKPIVIPVEHYAIIGFFGVILLIGLLGLVVGETVNVVSRNPELLAG